MILQRSVIVTTTAAVLLFLTSASSGQTSVGAFQPLSSSASSSSSSSQRKQRRRSSTPRWQQSQRTTQVGADEGRVVMNVNGDADSSNNDGGAPSPGSSSILLETDAKSRLFESFAALSMADQYDAVLTGLCAKILDSSEAREATVITALKEPMDLLNEMNQKRIEASPRSIMALIDSTVKTQDAATMAQVMSLCRRNGGGTIQYGNQQTEIISLPTSDSTRIPCPDGQRRTRQERLDNVADVPTDERVQEISSALTVVAVVGACQIVNIIGMDDVTPYANALLGTMLLVGAIDNGYDLIASASNLLVSRVGKDNDKVRNVVEMLPSKDSLPFGLGTGLATGKVVRGAARLVTMDAAREAQCEGAALFAAYALGLPCFAFQSNALEAAVLAVESSGNNPIDDDSERSPTANAASTMDSLLSDSGILRLLIWLYAPVAMESSKYPVCIMSDPRQADGFLERLESLAAKEPQIAQELWWLNDDNSFNSKKERDDLLKWAYTEADLLLRNNMKTVEQVAQRLEGGAATVGDVVAVLEDW